MSEKPKRLWGWLLLRWALIGLAVLVTLIAALVTEENWRGKRDWENYQRTAGAAGVRLDMASVNPPPVPDDQNFYCAPIVAGLLKRQQDQNPTTSMDRAPHLDGRMNFNIYRGDWKNWPARGGNWQQGTLTDLKPWQAYFRNFADTPRGKTNGFPIPLQPKTPAADTLLALSVFEPGLEELRQASQRPYARMPLDYDSGFDAAGQLLPWLAEVKQCSQLLELRSIAELDNGQGGPALSDIQFMLRLNDSLRDQPYLISHLVRIAVMSISLQPVYEGLAENRWSDAQLSDLGATLAGQDFLAEFRTAMQGEKIMAIQSFEKQRITREYKTWVESFNTNKLVTVSLRLMPSAYFYQNELAFARLHQKYILPLVDLTNRIVSPAALQQARAQVQSQLKSYSPYQAQALLLFPAISASVMKFARIQSQLDLAEVACALERYRLAHGEYPETLDVLSPRFIKTLPHDIINGQPLHYRRTDNVRFVLYSVGWDGKDDGGVVFQTQSGAVDQKRGDWVWQYPAK